MEPLPVEKIVAGLPAAVANLKADNWFAASQAIMTTDIVPKAVSKQISLDGTTVTITGIAKGSGMIRPNMATMLSYIATDAALSQPLLEEIVRHAAENSFNRITVDGDTSTNDAFILISTGGAGNPSITDRTSTAFNTVQDAVTEVAVQLAQAIVRDGEGAPNSLPSESKAARQRTSAPRSPMPLPILPSLKPPFSHPIRIWAGYLRHRQCRPGRA